MPELAFGYLIGFTLCTCLVGFHYHLQLKKINSKKMFFIQKNLSQVNFYWSETNAEIQTLTTDSVFIDNRNSLKTILIFGLACMVLSWLGLIFQFIILISIKSLAIKPIEKKLFLSDLALKELTIKEIQDIIN